MKNVYIVSQMTSIHIIVVVCQVEAMCYWVFYFLQF